MNRLICLFFLSLLFLVSCTTEIPPEKVCVVDDDCVPNACCHANDAVNKGHLPDCGMTMCTAVCEPGTLDCGGGEIKCVDGECKAIITS